MDFKLNNYFDIFLNAELFLPKVVSFIVSKYKWSPCAWQVVNLQANTTTIQVNVVTISYQIKDILNSEFKKIIEVDFEFEIH